MILDPTEKREKTLDALRKLRAEGRFPPQWAMTTLSTVGCGA